MRVAKMAAQITSRRTRIDAQARAFGQAGSPDATTSSKVNVCEAVACGCTKPDHISCVYVTMSGPISRAYPRTTHFFKSSKKHGIYILVVCGHTWRKTTPLALVHLGARFGGLRKMQRHATYHRGQGESPLDATTAAFRTPRVSLRSAARGTCTACTCYEYDYEYEYSNRTYDQIVCTHYNILNPLTSYSLRMLLHVYSSSQC